MRAATGRQRIDLVLQRVQIGVDAAHERVEMDARLAPDRHRRKEGVHQETLAAADAAPQVDTPWHVRRGKQPGERRSPRRAEFRQFVAQPLQSMQRRGLRGIQPRLPAPEERFEIFDERAERRAVFSGATAPLMPRARRRHPPSDRTLQWRC
jgi:hypothetical protein